MRPGGLPKVFDKHVVNDLFEVRLIAGFRVRQPGTGDRARRSAVRVHGLGTRARSGCARCGAGAGCSAIRYQSLQELS